MKKSTLLCMCIFVFIACKNNSSSKIYSTRLAILFMPDESMHDKVPGVTEEELASIEYEKTMAVYFLDSLDFPLEVTTDTILTFKNNDGTISKINTSRFSEWGIVLYDPKKRPKLIYLNELEVEFNRYFGLH